jgi:hypothetical protein
LETLWSILVFGGLLSLPVLLVFQHTRYAAKQLERWQREVQQEQREGEREREQRAWEQQQQQRNQQEARAQQARERAQEQEQRERAQREQRGGPRGTEQPRPWWEVLGVSERSSLDEAKAAYKIKQYHPDRVVGLGEELQQLADRKTKELNEAFNEARRRAST